MRLQDTRTCVKGGGYAREKYRRLSTGSVGYSLVSNTVRMPNSDTLDNPCFLPSLSGGCGMTHLLFIVGPFQMIDVLFLGQPYFSSKHCVSSKYGV